MKRTKSLDVATLAPVLATAELSAITGGSTAVAVAHASGGNTSIARASARDGQVVRTVVVNGVEIDPSAFDWRALLRH